MIDKQIHTWRCIFQNEHEREARDLVNSMTARDKSMMNERRRQYMMAFKRLENKRKSESRSSSGHHVFFIGLSDPIPYNLL